jgi:hypothetical protein
VPDQESDDRRILEVSGQLYTVANAAAAADDYAEYVGLRQDYYTLLQALSSLKATYRTRYKAEPPAPLIPDLPAWTGEVPPGQAIQEPVTVEEPEVTIVPEEPEPWETDEARSVQSQINRYSAQANQLRDQAVSELDRDEYDRLYQEYRHLRYEVISDLVVDYATNYLPGYTAPAIAEFPPYAGETEGLSRQDLLDKIAYAVTRARNSLERGETTEYRDEYVQHRVIYYDIRDRELPELVEEYRRRFDPDYAVPDLGDYPSPGPLPDLPPGPWEEAAAKWSWVLDGISGVMTGFITSLGDAAQSAGMGAPPLDVTDVSGQASAAIQGATRLITTGLTGLLSLVGMALAGETIGFWKHVGMGQIAAIIWDASSFRIITSAFIGAISYAVIGQPLRYNLNALLRPYLPQMRDISDAYAKREITQPQFDQAFAYMGIPDDWIEVYHRYIWRDPRLFEVVRIAEIAKVTKVPDPLAVQWFTRAGHTEWINEDWWYYLKFAKAGYDDIDVPVLVEVAKMAVARREQTLYLTQIRRLAREGYIEEERTRELLEEAWIPKDPVDFRLAGIGLEREYNLRAAVRSTVLSAMDHELITEAEAQEQLLSMGMDPGIVGLDMLRRRVGAVTAAMVTTSGSEAIEVPDIGLIEEEV